MDELNRAFTDYFLSSATTGTRSTTVINKKMSFSEVRIGGMVITGQIKLSNLKRLTGDKRSLVGSCVRTIGGRSGIPAPILDTAESLPLDRHILQAAAVKLASGRYLQDVGSFLRRGLQTRL